MENFNAAPADEPVSHSNLQAEWLADQKMPATVSTVELAMAQTDIGQSSGPGKDVATRLDGELRGFADAKQPAADVHVQALQKLVGDYCDNADKHAAMQKFGDETSKLRIATSNEIDGLNTQIDAAIAKNPTEQAQLSRFDVASQQFFDALQKLPFDQSSKIIDLMGWQDGENRSQHDARVAVGLSGDPKLQASFNQMAAAEDSVENAKTPQQKSLEAEVKQDKQDIQTINQIVNKAYIRSEIP
jgi:hypothetical protein